MKHLSSKFDNFLKFEKLGESWIESEKKDEKYIEWHNPGRET
jgi:hypothetical protein